MNPTSPEGFSEFIEAIRSARHGVRLYAEQYGTPALVVLANAIDEFCDAHSEVLLWKHDLENYAMKYHDVFIPAIMDKARTTQAYWGMTEEIANQVTECIPAIVAEIIDSHGKEV